MRDKSSPPWQTMFINVTAPLDCIELAIITPGFKPVPENCPLNWFQNILIWTKPRSLGDVSWSNPSSKELVLEASLSSLKHSLSALGFNSTIADWYCTYRLGALKPTKNMRCIRHYRVWLFTRLTEVKRLVAPFEVTGARSDPKGVNENSNLWQTKHELRLCFRAAFGHINNFHWPLSSCLQSGSDRVERSVRYVQKFYEIRSTRKTKM